MVILLMPCKHVFVPFSIYVSNVHTCDMTHVLHVENTNVPSMHPIVQKVQGCLGKKKMWLLGNHKTNLVLYHLNQKES